MWQSSPGPHGDVVCILGMHRSGTSLAARMVNLLGVYLGPDEHLRQANEGNPMGFWEHLRINELNDEILAKLGGSWYDPPTVFPGWHGMVELADVARRARRLIEEDFAGATLWGWKDPRTCLTLPFWQALVRRMRYLVCVRNPLDVARSLEKRNGFAFEKGADLWVRHMADAIEHTRGLPRLFVFYEDLVDDWGRELRSLARFVGREELAENPHIRSAIQKLVREGLQHHRSSAVDAAEEARLPLPAKALYLVLLAYARQSGDQPLETFSKDAATFQRELEGLRGQVRELTAALAEITGSTAWSLAQAFRRLRLKVAPSESLRERLLQRGMAAFRRVRGPANR